MFPLKAVELSFAIAVQAESIQRGFCVALRKKVRGLFWKSAPQPSGEYSPFACSAAQSFQERYRSPLGFNLFSALLALLRNPFRNAIEAHWASSYTGNLFHV